MDPAASPTLHAQVTMFQELLLLALPREIYSKQKLPLCSLYPRTVIFRTVGYVPFHSICYNLALVTACFTHS